VLFRRPVLLLPAFSFLVTHLVITSPYGVRSDPFSRRAKHHEGVDVESSHGEVVLAPFDGLAVQSGDARDGRGKCVRLLHSNGTSTVYGHLADTKPSMLLSWVSRGEPIGRVGSTGRSTGPHLHFECRDQAGASFDPLPVIASLGMSWAVTPQPAIRQRRARKKALSRRARRAR
jgi:murein DD-endopeptidase MepM/ murein hydrolase activator NlpD